MTHEAICKENIRCTLTVMGVLMFLFLALFFWGLWSIPCEFGHRVLLVTFMCSILTFLIGLYFGGILIPEVYELDKIKREKKEQNP
jgi:hypothetical protein